MSELEELVNDAIGLPDYEKYKAFSVALNTVNIYDPAWDTKDMCLYFYKLGVEYARQHPNIL